MTIQITDGFYINTDEFHRKSVGIESSRIAQCISRAQEISAYGLYGHPPHGFLENNLEFLLEIKTIKSISFTANNSFKNIDAIYSLPNLEQIGIFEKRPPIDFSLLTSIEETSFSFNKKDSGLGSLKKLKRMYFWHHKSVDGTFSNVELPASLEKLQINWSNACSLIEIPYLPNLKELQIHRCRNLEDISCLKSFAPNLETLKLTTSGKLKIETLEIDSLSNIKSISINYKNVL